MFRAQIERKKEYFEQKAIVAEVSETLEECDNKSLRLDLESKLHLARITVWEEATCFLEVIEIESERSVLNKNVVLTEARELDNEFEALVDFLA